VSHTVYAHLPAIGLGKRDPIRPHVTGGIGAGLPLFITEILGSRTYRDGLRSYVDLDAATVNAIRTYLIAERGFDVTERTFVPFIRSTSPLERLWSDVIRIWGKSQREGTSARLYLDSKRNYD